ncbi:MAG: polysaccharide pyruvyl transferase family protein [Kamptonema sp. SIO4C4]|nr:polysaccharide pyruvyl transferase family protein [Kamptonema sp. SIO4C4]
MKLFFYRRNEVQPNFGDELNPWLWNQLLPNILDEKEATTFFGIGTLLNNQVIERAPNAQQIVVFGTGVGYGKGLPKIDESWTIYCVRGPLSAYKLGLSPEMAVTDADMLIRRVYQPSEAKVHKYSYMPHFTQSIHGGDSWADVCQQAGVNYIDARWSIEKVLSELSKTEVLLTEAMHGAIIAEAFRIPWICIHTAMERLLPFKWIDFCESIGVSYRPYDLMPLQDLSSQYRWSWKEPLNFRGSRSALVAEWNHTFNKARTAEKMVDLIKRVPPNLGDDDHIERLTTELETRLQQFKKDVAAGQFA